MRKAIYLVVLLIFTASAFAQKITEKDLLGTWDLNTFETDGVTIDYKNSEILLSKKMKEKYGDKAESFRKMMSDELKKDKPKPQEFFFENESKVVFRKEGDEPLIWHYSLFEKDGAQYIKMNGGDFKMTIAGKVITLSGTQNNGEEITMTYEKKRKEIKQPERAALFLYKICTYSISIASPYV
ncbi:hypothetical protein OGH69_04840 [Flavobacterium sp. MFBS3-15]|uniref:hypothetical protein n=1 Tax=Flavobacterium sp. MFBS3-15 TaxID=2989816 RepID=UPI0022367B4D|nr:hypothetical protein [Flavobacterium sp. MFBS3-15]MCW4468285.1 hypothetical protein [Flavobacterium sp. MFBS3-15]